MQPLSCFEVGGFNPNSIFCEGYQKDDALSLKTPSSSLRQQMDVWSRSTVDPKSEMTKRTRGKRRAFTITTRDFGYQGAREISFFPLTYPYHETMR